MAAFGVAVITKEVFVEIHLLKKHGFSLRQTAHYTLDRTLCS